MKSRKLISFLGAAAMAGSAFSGLAMTAFAEDTVLYSDNFNGYTTSAKTADGTVFAVATADDNYESVKNNADWSWLFNSPDSQDLGELSVGIEGSCDDTAALMITEKTDDSSDKYLSMFRNRFLSRGIGSITGFENYAANEGEELVIDFDLMLTDGVDGGTTYPSSISFTGLGDITTETVTSGSWVNVRIVSANGTTTLYVDGDQTLTGTSLTAIGPTKFTADTRIGSGDYPEVSIDNLVIMSVASGTGATVEVPDAETVTPIVPTEAPPAATIEATTTIDFDDTSITPVEERSVAATVVAGSAVGNETNVMQIVGSSTNSGDTRFGYSTLDLSEYTAGKSHVIIDYDAYISSDGRMTYVLSDGIPVVYSDAGLFRQGVPGSSAVNANTNEWIHTTVDVDLASGTGTYEVTGADEAVIAQGNITTDKQQLTTLSFLSWSPNTSYIDNIVIQTGGSMTITTPPPAATITPEPASEVAGSGLNLVPENAAETIASFAPATTAEVLNHATAGVAVTTGNTDINAYSASARGYSIYAIYDVYVGVDSSFALTPYGDSGKAQAATMQLVSDNTGVVTVSSIGKDGVVTAAPETLAHGTWYRVLVEVPQSGTSDAPVTNDLTYTVYRIDASDPTKVTEIAAQQTGLTPRGLATKGLTSFGYAVTGEAYIDNLAVFRATGGLDITPEAETTPEPASTESGSGLTLMPEEGAAIDSLAAGSEEVLNHANATAVTTDGITVNAYSDNVRGYSVYAAFDAYVDKGTTLTILPVGNNDAQASTINLTASDLGKVTLSAVTGQGANDVVTADDTLAAGTWYRVLVEAPQNAVSEGETASTSTGTITVTVYRINVDDPSEVTEVAAQLTGLPARGLDGKALTGFTVSATAAEAPSAYVDNFATFRADNALTLIPETWYVYTATYDASGILTNITAEEVEDPSTVVPSDAENTRTFVWNNFMQPYVAETEEPAE